MQQLWWVPVVLGVVVFSCVALIVVRAIARSQERSGRGSRALRAGAVPAAVPVVIAAVSGVGTVVLARAFVMAGMVTAGVAVVVALVLFGWDRLDR